MTDTIIDATIGKAGLDSALRGLIYTAAGALAAKAGMGGDYVQFAPPVIMGVAAWLWSRHHHKSTQAKIIAAAEADPNAVQVVT